MIIKIKAENIEIAVAPKRKQKKHCKFKRRKLSFIPKVFFSSDKKEDSIVVEAGVINLCLTVLKMHIKYRYTILNNIIGLDLIQYDYRFCVIYDLLSLLKSKRIRVKVFLNNDLAVLETCSFVFKNAIWWEREVWDMFGIFFKGNPDLRRILTDYGFYGYPLRKDFPLSGYSEIYYNFSKKRIVFEDVELSQEFRFFNFEYAF